MKAISYYRTRLRAKGQVTVPGEIRHILGVEEGDELVFIVNENGMVIVERVHIYSSRSSLVLERALAALGTGNSARH